MNNEDTLNALIQQQRAEIEKLREEFQEYAYVVSHDFSAPIRQIEGFVALVKKSMGNTLDDKNSEHFQFIENAVHSARTMLEGLLVYSRIESTAETNVEVNLNHTLEKALKTHQESIEASGAHIEKPELPTIMAEAKHMEMLLSALLSNALTFHHKGTQPYIEITYKESESEHSIIIKDNGTGLMDGEKVSKLFIPLRKGRNGKLSSGPGMGLANAKRIMDHAHGTVFITNNEEETGCNVILTFPKA